MSINRIEFYVVCVYLSSNMASERFDMRLKHDASMIVSGPTQSGKSTFTVKLLEARKFIFDQPLEHMFWYYGIAQSYLHNKLRTMNVHLEEGLPSNFDRIPKKSIIVIDDLSSEMKTNKAVTQLFTRVAHHNQCFVILITQNLFEKGPELRTQHLNAQYLTLFKNPRDSLQVSVLGMQMYPHRKQFLNAAFNDATSRSHGYLLIDNHQLREEHLRLRTNILPNEQPMKAYIPRL